MGTSLISYNHIQKFWLAEHNKRSVGILVLCNHVICADGFSMSVQASEYHYCLPRTYLPDGEYTHWEVLPYYRDELFDEFGDEDVMAYVPTKIVNAVIEKHGGISLSRILNVE